MHPIRQRAPSSLDFSNRTANPALCFVYPSKGLVSIGSPGVGQGGRIGIGRSGDRRVPGQVRERQLVACLSVGVGETVPPVRSFLSPLFFLSFGPDYVFMTGMVRLNCKYVWPQNVRSDQELNTPEYYGKLKGDWVVEKQLAMGGSESFFLSMIWE